MSKLKISLITLLLSFPLLCVVALGIMVGFYIHLNSELSKNINNLEQAEHLASSNGFIDNDNTLIEAKQALNTPQIFFKSEKLNKDLNSHKAKLEQDIIDFRKGILAVQVNIAQESLKDPMATSLSNYEDINKTVAETQPQNESQTLEDINKKINNISLLNKEVQSELESIKSEQLYKKLTDTYKQADTLINFFNKYKDYSKTIVALEDYKTNINDLVQNGKQKTMDMNTVNTNFNTEFATVTDAEKLKTDVEKKINEQKQANIAKSIVAPKVKEDAPKLILVSIPNQTLYLYEYGVPVFSTPVTTGKDLSPTNKGHFSVYYKARNTRLKGVDTSGHPYDVPVNYWMPFNPAEEEGIHDTPTKTNYGGSDYTIHGSLGCVRTPLTAVSHVFEWAEIGTPVWVE
jgi:lipoprotein-anchoring transpeptidase ErfK/SrfK